MSVEVRLEQQDELPQTRTVQDIMSCKNNGFSIGLVTAWDINERYASHLIVMYEGETFDEAMQIWHEIAPQTGQQVLILERKSQDRLTSGTNPFLV